MQFLIEQERELLKTGQDRQAAADGRIAVALSASLGLVALSFTILDDVKAASQNGKLGFALVVFVAAAVALLRAVAGYLHGGTGRWFSTHSGPSDRAMSELRALEAKVAGFSERSSDERADVWQALWPGPHDPGLVEPPQEADERVLALIVWRNQAIDARTRARRRERASALAMLLLSAVLLTFGLDAMVQYVG